MIPWHDENPLDHHWPLRSVPDPKSVWKVGLLPVRDRPAFPHCAQELHDILTADLKCRRRWLRHTRRSGAEDINQSGVAWVLALTLWERGEICESQRQLPRSLKDRVSRALSGRLITTQTLDLFVEAFDLNQEQEDRLYAAWEADRAAWVEA